MVRKSVSPCWATFTPQPDSDSAGDAYQRSDTSVEKLAAPALAALARPRARMVARPVIEPPPLSTRVMPRRNCEFRRPPTSRRTPTSRLPRLPRGPGVSFAFRRPQGRKTVRTLLVALSALVLGGCAVGRTASYAD